jgi:hypothetical protein
MKRTTLSLLALGAGALAGAALVYAQQVTPPGSGVMPAELHRELAEWQRLACGGAGKDAVLHRLQRQVAELTNLLVLERDQGKKAQDELAALQATLASLRAENERLAAKK